MAENELKKILNKNRLLWVVAQFRVQALACLSKQQPKG
jgi:hypothetical protein